MRSGVHNSHFSCWDGGVVWKLRPTKLSPATQENVPASPAPGPRCGFTFHLISCYVIPLCLMDQGAENLTPDGSSHFVVHAILDVWHARHKNFHFISAVSLRALLHFRYHHHYQHHSISSCVTLFRENPSRSASVCVCVLVHT